ncbi:unnamed protein product [Mesocestoides corti]|uniref:Uncharacterized protein n=1 Tax=Mesocestoides corti TaxID=53468 RepID=A0A0R3U2N8_MESCO|nr:unnamed protein product [Mesocestoides corti]
MLPRLRLHTVTPSHEFLPHWTKRGNSGPETTTSLSVFAAVLSRGRVVRLDAFPHCWAGSWLRTRPPWALSQ